MSIRSIWTEQTVRERLIKSRIKAHMTKILVIDDDARDRGLLIAVLEGKRI